MQIRVDSTVIETKPGDIAKQADLEAVVNAANAQLQPGGGVAGALHRAAGPQLAAAGRNYAPIKPGEAVITPAFKLPNEYVIHCLGPVYGRDKPAAGLLADCYSRALEIAAENNIGSLGVPALSTGAFGYPMGEAAKIAVRTILSEVVPAVELTVLRFVLYDRNARKIYDKVLKRAVEA